jgi:SAM-dependent methyltransferase
MIEIQSDKSISGLFTAYETLFSDLKTEPIKYLEMGILNGGSLVWAKNYFAEGSLIYGLDRTLPPEIEGIVMQQIEQNDSVGLVDFGKLNGPFDIIIDDGSHVRVLTENTFNCLYQFLKPGGLYIIEDWGAGYFPQWSHCKGMETLVTDLVWKYCGSVVRPKSGGSFAIIEKNVI